MENNIRPVSTPDEAAAQFTGEQYMEWVMDYLDRQVKSWPSLRAIADSQPRPERVRKFMLQRYLAHEAFAGGRDGDPGFLGFAVANLSEASDPGAERALEILEARRQELVGPDEMTQNPHKAQWTKLLVALGLSADDMARAEAKEPTRNYVDELADIYSNAEWQVTMAAFAAHEKLAAEELPALSAMLKGSMQVAGADLDALSRPDRNGAKYAQDAGHVLESVAVDREGKDLIFQGVKRQLDARRDFYDALVKYLQD